jgi:hypothetical protein
VTPGGGTSAARPTRGGMVSLRREGLFESPRHRHRLEQEQMMGQRSSLLFIAFVLVACGRSELLPGTPSLTDAATIDTSASEDGSDLQCIGEPKADGCPCTNGTECQGGFCATEYAPRLGSAECDQAEVGKCREFPQHDCACMVTEYGNEGHCYE